MPASDSKAALALQASLAGSQFFLQREPVCNEQESVPGDWGHGNSHVQTPPPVWRKWLDPFTVLPGKNIQMKSIIHTTSCHVYANRYIPFRASRYIDASRNHQCVGKPIQFEFNEIKPWMGKKPFTP